jgi:fumarate reductase flavoprotein subunit
MRNTPPVNMFSRSHSAAAWLSGNLFALFLLTGAAGGAPAGAGPKNLAELHKAGGMACVVCHDEGSRASNDNLSEENANCSFCHGTLKNVSAEIGERERDPHQSHLPGDLSCTACHSAHRTSVPYCAACHNFEFSLRFSGEWQREERGIAELVEAAAARNAALADSPRDRADVIVIGSGGAGLSAAVAAADAGASVILLEKEPVIGGNSKLAAGGLNAAETKQQAALGIQDSVEQMTDDTIRGGKEKNDPALVKVLVNDSAGTVDWLTGMGADMSDVGRMGGASVDRTHRPTGGLAVGKHIVQVLYDKAMELGVDLRLNSRAVEIVADDKGAVRGVLVQGEYTGVYRIDAPAVVVAAGGFGKNNELVADYDAKLKGFAATNQPGATGDGITVAQRAGAATVDMGYIQAHPTYSPVGGVLVTEAVRGNGAILVNDAGERFVNELTTRDVAAAAILEQPGDHAWLVFDQAVRESLEQIEGYVELGAVNKAASVPALADAIGVDGAVLDATVRRYNELVSGGSDADFSRQDLPVTISEPAFYAIEVTPAVHHTMGGLKINSATEVLNAKGDVMAGLYAAGEVTGGVHGANRLGGNAVSEIVTFGRRAGTKAAGYSAK